MSQFAIEAVGGVVELGLYELLRQRLLKEVPVAAPAAGTEWTQGVPINTTWELIGVHYILNTSAVVANRTPRLDILDAGNVRLARINPAVVVAAAAAAEFSYLAGVGFAQAAAPEELGLPDPPLLLGGGFTIGSNTLLIDAGDTYTGIVLYVREWSVDRVFQAASWLDRHIPG